MHLEARVALAASTGNTINETIQRQVQPCPR